MFYASIIALERSAYESSDSYLSFTLILCLVFASVPLVSTVGLILHQVFSRSRFCLRLFHRHTDYVAVGGDDDADAYCDRAVNPKAYPSYHSQMATCSSNA